MSNFLFNDDLIIQQAYDIPLNTKIDKAISLIGEYESNAIDMSDDGYCLAFSGGKDSAVIAKLAEIAGIRHTMDYSVTTLDPPELVRHIKDNYNATFHRQPRALLTEMVENTSCKGPPTRLMRWCCEKYKENTGNQQWKILGIRAAESPRRKKAWKQVIINNNNNKTCIVNPILYWTDKDVWDFHRDQRMSSCCLYSEGFDRLGCIGCPMAGARQQRIGFDRWPRYEFLWRRAFDRFWDKWSGVPTKQGKRRYFEDFGSAQGFWDWWVSGTRKRDDSPCLGMSELWS